MISNQRQGKKHFLFITTILIISFFTHISVAVDTNINDLEITIPTSDPMTKYGKQVWIRGIWHSCNFSIDIASSKITLVFYYGDNLLLFTEKNETNFYQWEFNNGIWSDNEYDSDYIEEDYCINIDGLYSFYIGIDQAAFLGNWTLTIFVADQEIDSYQIYIEQAVTSLGLRTIPVSFRVEPFLINNYFPDENITMENLGNVPLSITANYGSYDDVFSTLDDDVIIKPGESKKLHLLIQSKSSWHPNTITVTSTEVSINGKVKGIIPPKNIVNLIESTISIGLPIIITVVHSGYELRNPSGEISFQYIENFDIFYNEVRTINAFLSGNGIVTVDIHGDNIDILKIFSEDEEVESPFTLVSTNYSEALISVQIRGIMPNSTGVLYYQIDIDGEVEEFTTLINIGSFRPDSGVSIFTMQMIGLVIGVIIIVLILYIVFSQMKYKR